MRCLYVVKSLIRRVGYAVDVDVDGICATTRPCFSAVQYHRTSRPDVHTLHVPVHELSKLSQSRTTSVPREHPAKDKHHADVVMSQAGSQDDYSSQQAASSYHDSVEEMLDVPVPGNFFPTTEPGAWEFGMQQTGAFSSTPSTTTSEMPGVPITSADIAAFMHINPVDRGYRSMS